jgi:alpha-galactosidase
MTKLAFIGAGSTIFMKNIVGDMLHFEALRDAEIALMDIDARRLEESRMVAEKMIATMGTGATVGRQRTVPVRSTGRISW